MTTFDLFTVATTIHKWVGEMGIGADAAVFAAILIFLGGLVFWFLMACAAITGLVNLVRRLFRRVLPAMERTAD